jgi:hypothetical protein
MDRGRVGASRTYNRGFFLRLSLMIGAVVLTAYALLPDAPQTHVPLELTALPATGVKSSSPEGAPESAIRRIGIAEAQLAPASDDASSATQLR